VGLRKFWLPRTARPRYVCRVPTENGICGKEFYEHERLGWEQHVASCARQHEQQIHELHEEKRPAAFFRPFDEEYAAWVRQHGRVG
jgi:hypothetical protein